MLCKPLLLRDLLHLRQRGMSRGVVHHGVQAMQSQLRLLLLVLLLEVLRLVAHAMVGHAGGIT